VFQVKATGGDTYLGGEDFDRRIIDWLITRFHEHTKIDLRQDRMALQRLKEGAEKAKCELSGAQQTEIVLPFISADGSGPKHLNTVLSRDEYEKLTDDLLERTIEPCKRCLADAGVTPDDIDEVLLVGGQTRAPKVSTVVASIFGRQPNRAINPDEGVAMGAAIQGGILQRQVKDLVLLDVTPHTLGIETKGGTFTPLIDRNSTIPTRKSKVFTTVEDNQSRVEVHVLQGESDMAVYNKSLAKFELTNIPSTPRGIPQIDVSFEIDVDGIVSVSARDLATARAQSMTIHPSSGLNQAEVSRLADETRALADEDRRREEREALVRKLKGLISNAIRSVQVLEAKLTSEEKETVLEAITRGSKAVSKADEREGGTEELQAYLADLEKAAGIIAQAMLRNQEAPGTSPSGAHAPTTHTEPLSASLSVVRSRKPSR
jgi:molecular chaperone DnaK